MSLLRNVHRPYSHLDDEEEAIRKRCQGMRMKRRWFHNTRVALTAITTILVLLGIAGATVYLVAPWKAGFNLLSMHMSVLRQSSPGGGGGFENALLVKTNCGQYAGLVEDGAFAFKGIPYAVPPIGELRWKKTVPIWSDSQMCSNSSRRKAHHFSSPCFQLSPYTKQYTGDEDCLYLNVWSPRIDASADLEVMVWVHGGFLHFGSGHHRGLCPSAKLAKKLNTVFVSMNYRLHALGFMALDLLVGSILADGFGNYGLWDIIVALQWVQENIRNFGGDPRKVTVFGPDAGAAAILAMMTSRVGSDLFRSAWLIGPSSVFNRTFEDLEKHNTAFFLARSGCHNVECLRHMSSKEILLAYLGKDDPSFRIRDQNDLPIQGIYPEQLIVIDGDLLTATPKDTILSGHAYDIPLLIDSATYIKETLYKYQWHLTGSLLIVYGRWDNVVMLPGRQEFDVSAGTGSQSVDVWPGPEDLSLWSWNQLRKYVTTSLDSFDPRISQMALHLYNETESDDELCTPERQYATMVTDLRQTCPVKDLSIILSSALRSPLYRYVVTSTPSKEVKVYDYKSRYSFHMWEAIAFLDQIDVYIEDPNQEDLEFRDRVQSTVMSFVQTDGSTVASGWCRYPTCIALLSTNLSYVDTYQKRQCKFWTAQGLTDYAWVS